MKNILTILALLFAVILQTTLVKFLDIYGVAPNLVLVLILLWVIFKGFEKVWFGVVLAGIFLDFFSGLPFGLISLSLVGAAYLIDWFNRKVFSGIRFWITLGLVGLGSLFYNLLLICLTKMFYLDLFFGLKYWSIGLIYNLFIAAIFYGAKKIFCEKQNSGKY